MKEYFQSIENWKYSDNAVAFLCYEFQGCVSSLIKDIVSWHTVNEGHRIAKKQGTGRQLPVLSTA